MNHVDGVPARRRVFMHVGSPKTGTTFLQEVLWRQKALAAQHGVLLPMGTFADHYHATLDVRELTGPEDSPHAEGTWQAIVAEALEWDGDVLVSHELFAGATEQQAHQALAAFPESVEVHVVVTARDLVRQIPAEWQEHVKHRSSQTFGDFVAMLREERPGTWFWRVQDYPRLLQRWGAGLPAERLHVVTVPPSGSEPAALWTRFAGLLGLPAAEFDLEHSRPNTSLGYEQAELLRRVNIELGDRLPLPGPYPMDVKNFFAQTVLSRRPGSRFGLQGDHLEWAVARSARMADELRALGVDVVGDLADLTPTPKEEPELDLDALVRDDRILAEGVAALAAVLDERHERRLEVQSLRHRLHEAETIPVKVLAKRRLKERLVARSERSAGFMLARRAYRRLRRPRPKA